MSDEKSFLIFLIVGLVITLLAIVFIWTVNPTMRRWMEMTLQLIGMMQGNLKTYIMEANI